MAYNVDDIDAISSHLRDAGVRLLYDAPKQGTANSRINFVHPKDAGGVLIELVESAADGDGPLTHPGVVSLVGQLVVAASGVASAIPATVRRPGRPR